MGGERLILENSTVCQKSMRLIGSTPSVLIGSLFGCCDDRWFLIRTILQLSGFVCQVGLSMESLILAQDERWRRA